MHEYSPEKTRYHLRARYSSSLKFPQNRNTLGEISANVEKKTIPLTLQPKCVLNVRMICIYTHRYLHTSGTTRPGDGLQCTAITSVRARGHRLDWISQIRRRCVLCCGAAADSMTTSGVHVAQRGGSLSEQTIVVF